MTVDRAATQRILRVRTPLHRQVRDSLLAAIRQGAYHARLPPEDALAEELGVSRTTLRSALLELERDGHVVRRQGIGTFVAGDASTVTERLDQLQSIPSLIAGSGFQPTVRSVSVRHRVRSAAAAQALGRAEASRFTAVRRVYLADGRPAALVVDYLPGSSRLDEALATFDGEMLPILDAALGTRVELVRATVTAVNAGRSVGRDLGVPASTALFLLHHSILDRTGRVCAYGESYLIPGIFTLTVVRQRE